MTPQDCLTCVDCTLVLLVDQHSSKMKVLHDTAPNCHPAPD